MIILQSQSGSSGAFIPFRDLPLYVLVSNSGDISFLPCLFVSVLVCWFVSLFVGWTTLTLVITFEPFQIEPLYLACRFLVTRAFHLYNKL